MPRRDEAFSITSVGPSASDDRRVRMRRYIISMSIRTVCFLLGIAIQGVAGLLFLAAAVFLPYVAVVLANQIARPRIHHQLPPLIIKDTSELPVGHPDRTEPAV